MKKEITGEWQIVPLSESHDRDSFDCGVEPLNRFLKTQARQQQVKYVGKTFVAISENEPRKILGFYTLSAGSTQFEHLPINLKIPKYPVPIARIGRLARDNSMTGKNLGEFLLEDALNKSAQIASEQMGLVGVIVDAKDDKAKAFYEKFGFVSLKGLDYSLFIPIKTVIDAMKGKL